MKNFTYVQSIKCLSSNSPFIFDKPWYNIQKPNDYLPVHTHDGVLSYTIWLKLPLSSEFIFYYSGIVSQRDYTMKLTPKDVGNFIIFPSTLHHRVETSKDEILRWSLSFNTFVKGELGKSDQVTKLWLA